MVNVADQFGLDLANAARPKLAEAGFELVMDKSYPLGTPDLGQLITEAMRLEPDAFLAFSYPPDTFGLSEQAKTLGFNPKVFYTAVGTAFPIYLQMFGTSAEGVIGIGGWDPSSAEAQAYFQRHKAVTGAEPDQWASPVTYASLQVLQQAIERAGTIDRAAVMAEIAKGGFETVAGPITFEENQRKKQWLVGQWQGGTFYGVRPTDLPNAKPLVFPKPAW
jgi:branched-chain amino acid transport system substrate-binding protein